MSDDKLVQVWFVEVGDKPRGPFSAAQIAKASATLRGRRHTASTHADRASPRLRSSSAFIGRFEPSYARPHTQGPARSAGIKGGSIPVLIGKDKRLLGGDIIVSVFDIPLASRGSLKEIGRCSCR